MSPVPTPRPQPTSSTRAPGVCPPIARSRGPSKWRCSAARTGLFIIAFSMRFKSMGVRMGGERKGWREAGPARGLRVGG